jgi:hypothetical protein
MHARAGAGLSNNSKRRHGAHKSISKRYSKFYIPYLHLAIHFIKILSIT